MACWITAPKYRLRLYLEKGRALVTDLRIFSARWPDPYTTEPAQFQGNWVVPYLIDGSLWHQSSQKRSIWQALLSPPEVEDLNPQPQFEEKTTPTALKFPSPIDNFQVEIEKKSSESAKIGYNSERGRVQFQFSPTQVELSLPPGTHPEYEAHVPESLPILVTAQNRQLTLTWEIDHQPLARTNLTCDSIGTCHWQFAAFADHLIQAQETQYPFLFPESRPRVLDNQRTGLYAHNRYAVAGRNPARLVLQPIDSYGFPTSLKTEPQISTQPEISLKTTSKKSANETTEFIDLINNYPQKTHIGVLVDDQLHLDTTVYFAPNCKEELMYCAFHPVQAWWYLNAVGRDAARRLLLHESQ